MSRITAIVLAAGASSRMGRSKALLPWGDTTVLGQVLANLEAAAIRDVVVVVADPDEGEGRIALGTGARVAVSPGGGGGEDADRSSGAGSTMTESLQAGIRSLTDDSGACLILLADQPMIGPGEIERVVKAHEAGGHDLVSTTFGGRRGHPVLFARRYFDELASLGPSDPPRTVLRRRFERLHLVNADSDVVLGDLDTPEAYAYWVERELGVLGRADP